MNYYENLNSIGEDIRYAEYSKRLNDVALNEDFFKAAFPRRGDGPIITKRCY